MAKKPRIIVWDLEFFHLNWGADLGFVLCMAWKVVGEEKVHLESIAKYNDGTFMDDGPLVDRCARILESADMWVTYNGIRADIPFIQTRLLINRKPLMGPNQHKDLIYTVRHKLKLSRNRLLDIQNAMALEGTVSQKKTPVRLEQWLKVAVKHDMKALAEIEHHCKQDVLVLEEQYLHLRPLLLNHPRLFGYMEPVTGTMICNKCGGELEVNKRYMTSGKLPRVTLQCKACRGYETRPDRDVKK